MQSVISGQQPESPLAQSYKTYQAFREDTKFGVEWISVGPVVNSARVESVQLDPSAPGTMYVAFGSGGLWKTTNNGQSWHSIFDSDSAYGIGDIAIAPSRPKTLYVGTGESLKKARNYTIPGTGIYRSDDGGESWKHLGLNDSWHIGEIAVHPQNPDVVLVAVLGHFWSPNEHRGLYLTKDGGKTWQHVIKIDENTGANDVVWSASDPKVAYASTWEMHPGVAGKNSGVYRTGDGGQTWTKCQQGFPSGEQIGRIGLAVSYQDANKVYALVDNREFAESAAAQIYCSEDGGKTWKRTHKSDLKFLSRIGWYFADIYVNPQDDQEIFALGVRLAHSKNGGQTFQYISGNVQHIHPSAASGLHLDQCEMWIDPAHPNHLVLGNDGGLYQTYDQGKNWRHFNNIPTGEFYDIEIDQTTPYRIFAGAQDDATVYGPPTEFDPVRPDPWKYLWIDPWNGGDGCITLVDPNDPNTVYYSAQEGAFRRKDMQTNRHKGIRPHLPKEITTARPNAKLRFNFVGPMTISPHDSNTLLLGANYVFKSVNRGEQWQAISPDLCDPKADPRESNATSVVIESALEKGLYYAGTDKGTLWVSENGGESWANRTQDLPVGYIRSICPSAHQKSRVYLTLSGLNYDEFGSHVYCSEDRGLTWKRISASLPAEPANVILEDPFHPDLLWLGTFRSVYFSHDRGQTWSLFGKNLKTCSIGDMAIHKECKELILGTHGRGIYKTNLAPIYEILTKHLAAKEALNNKKTVSKKAPLLCKVPDATFPRLSDTRPSTNFRAFEKTTISYWLPQQSAAKLAVFKRRPDDTTLPENAAPIVMFEIPSKAGLNQFRWDLVTKTNQSDQPYFIRYKNHLQPGDYWIRIVADGQTSVAQTFVVKESPESKSK